MNSSDHKRRVQLTEHYERITSDEYGSRWSLSNPGNRASLAERQRYFEADIRQHLTFQRGRLLDLGCGSASVVPALGSFDVIGVDLLFERLHHADHPTAGSLVNADGSSLPFPDESFETVALFTTLSSVTDPEVRKMIAVEIERVLRPGGLLVWYDFRHPSPGNRAVRPIGKSELRRLFPAFEQHVRTMTLLPPLARRLGRWTDATYPRLTLVPILRSHIGGVLVKPH